MTIALGVLGSDSVVLAADTEITWSQMKSSERKVWGVSGSGGLAITGAGDSDYLQAINQRLQDSFTANDTLSVDELENTFSEVMEDFYERHVVPFSPVPEIRIIIGIERKGQRRLWTSAGNALTRQNSYACVGSGREYAALSWEPFWTPQPSAMMP
jgi:20S proteasome alpha/beta subunit